ncbi:MAG: single-stranded-DNA-specific exonuclease RecJ [Candidatus Taylorbacteria bacterium]|nr:single-stranded-DNA-specific exonuclease RecJ [Candidatus Taylorbacteria bacterium]
MKTFSVREAPSQEIEKNLLGYSPLVRRLLHGRGIVSAEFAEAFLNPHYEHHSHDPFLMKDMEKTVDRVLQAVRDNEKIVIYSDYDTDGIPGAVVLHDFFRKIGFSNFINYIPHRHDEGFGLNIEAVEQFAKDGVKLLITIDCGTGDVISVARAKELGLDVIVTDHHLPVGELPPVFAMLNPKQADCAYPEKMLCGAGVIFKLVQALCSRFSSLDPKLSTLNPVSSGWEKWLLDMVGIATLSDMVPLTGENRVFAYYGLKVLQKSPRVGLMKLLSKLKVNQRHITEDDIGFTIGPRINAASRMGVPMDAFRLLATTDEVEADTLADHLNKINDERKGTVAALSKEIKKIVRERYDSLDEKTRLGKQENRVMVIGNPSWRPALLGLAANTFANEYNCPVFLWGRDGDDVIKGSCRSGESANLVELMGRATPGTFLQFGGHAFSGGFSVSNEKIHTLEEELNRAYEKARLAYSGIVEKNLVDQELFLDEANWENYRIVEKLAPFGTGNPKPLFIFRDVVPREVKHFGKEKNHLELVFEKTDGKKLSAMTFFKTAKDWGREVVAGKPLDLVATFEKSMFKSYPELRLRIVDIV